MELVVRVYCGRGGKGRSRYGVSQCETGVGSCQFRGHIEMCIAYRRLRPYMSQFDPRERSLLGCTPHVIAGVSGGNPLLVLAGANARAGKRESECADSKVLGTYGRDKSNDNGEGLLRPPPRPLVDRTLFNLQTGANAMSPDYILPPQADRRLVRNITVRKRPDERQKT